MTRRRIVIKTRDAVALRKNFNFAARREGGGAASPANTKKRPTRTRIGLYRRSMKGNTKPGMLRLRLMRRFVGMLPRAGILLCLARKERGDGTVHRSPHFAARSRPPLAFPRPARSPQQKMSGQKSAQFIDGDLAGNRTRDCAVRGRRLNRLTTRPRRKLCYYSISGAAWQLFFVTFAKKFLFHAPFFSARPFGAARTKKIGGGLPPIVPYVTWSVRGSLPCRDPKEAARVRT